MDSPGTTPDGASAPGQEHRSWPMVVTVVVLVGALLTAAVLALAIGRNSSSTPAAGEGSPEAAEDGAPDDPPTTSEDGGEGTEAPDDHGSPAASRPEGDVALFLCDGRVCPEITDEQLLSLETSLTGDSMVLAVHYESSAEAYERFLELFADQPQMTQAIDEDTLPPSFRVWLHDPDDADDLAARFADHLGVDQVTVTADLPSSRLDGNPPEVDEAWLREGIDAVPAMRIELCDGRRCPEASGEDRAAIEAALDAHPLVTSAFHRSREDAYEQLFELFADKPELLEHVTPDLMPEVYDVFVVDHEAWLDDPGLFYELAEDLRDLDGVEWFTDGMGEVRDLLPR